jgi:hypothetical protein
MIGGKNERGRSTEQNIIRMSMIAFSINFRKANAMAG